MIDFDLVIPTKVFFGKRKENNVGEIIKQYGFNKCVVVTGQGSVIKTGLLNKVSKSLQLAGIDFQVFSGVRANPTIQCARELLDLVRNYKPDILLAVGGGSVMDTAKNAAVGYYYDGDSFDFNKHIATPTKALPIGTILTISASGSEMSSSCVIQDDESNIKQGFNSDLVRPLFAIENPELSFTCPQNQKAYGIVDIIMHTFERYMCPSDEIEPADGFAITVLKSVVQVARKVYENPTDYDSHAVLMLMSSYSHNDITNIGKTKIMPLHALEHCISGVYPEVAHGAGLAVVFPAWCRYYLQYDIEKFNNLAKNIFGLNHKDKYKNGLAGIKAFEKLFLDLNMPRKFKDLGIKRVNINKLLLAFSKDGTRRVGHHSKPLDVDVAREIFNSCR